MLVQKSRWSKVYESSEEELIEFLQSRGIKAERWNLEEFDTLQAQSEQAPIVVWCAEGSLNFAYESQSISVQPGDMLRIPASLSYVVTAGMSGCVCYQV